MIRVISNHVLSFTKAVIGLSGGIDSALVTTIAVDALGKENVVAVSMPSRYSSAGSINDSKLLTNNLDIELLSIPIEKIHQAYLDTVGKNLNNMGTTITEENIQSII